MGRIGIIVIIRSNKEQGRREISPRAELNKTREIEKEQDRSERKQEKQETLKKRNQKGNEIAAGDVSRREARGQLECEFGGRREEKRQRKRQQNRRKRTRTSRDESTRIKEEDKEE